MGWDGASGRGEFRDLRGSTAGLKNRLFQDGIYTLGCYLKSCEIRSYSHGWGLSFYHWLQFICVNSNIVPTFICNTHNLYWR